MDGFTKECIVAQLKKTNFSVFSLLNGFCNLAILMCNSITTLIRLLFVRILMRRKENQKLSHQ